MALLLLVLLVAPHARPQGTNGNGAPVAAPDALPGFVHVPAGKVTPGCTYADFKARAGSDPALQAVLQYERWGDADAPILDGFQIGRYEVTNAQWKLYFDSRFRREHVTSGDESLRDISARYVVRPSTGDPDDTEWKAIFCFNWEVLVDALQKAQEAENARPLAEGESRQVLWNPAWTAVDPKPGNDLGVEGVRLPKGLTLSLYAATTPKHWYGWSKLSGLRVGRDYCDIRKAPVEAFTVPTTGFFADLRLRATDFAAYPIRDISVGEALAFAEWAGCHLASEYQWERTARGDRDNTCQFPGAEQWNRNAETTILAWQNNPACSQGPLAVDDASVSRSDSPYGVRHMLGNVYELTRTFYDKHPDVTPKLGGDSMGLFNYALLAKGGSWGDGWQLSVISARTGTVGYKADLALASGNRADSLGIRLVRHEKPGQDLLMHSILRLAYNAGRGAWNDPLPHAYAMPRMAGIDLIHARGGGSPYDIFQAEATGVAMAPLWMSAEMTQSAQNQQETAWKQGKSDGRSDILLGVLRSDLPLRGGVRLTSTEATELRAARETYKKAVDESKKRKPKKGEPPIVIPPEPPAPDAFEKATEKNAAGVGMWRERTIPAGEWTLVYWYGFLGLRNKGGMLEGILMMDDKAVVRKVGPAAPATLAKHGKLKDALVLTFSVEEDNDPKKPQLPPPGADSEHWALCESNHPQWSGWPGRKTGKAAWNFEVTLPFEKDTLSTLIPENK